MGSIRFKEEFYCGTECGKYFLTYLRTNMNGNYTIECPNCQHHHYRVVMDGIITQDRHSKKYELSESIMLMGLESTIRDNPWHNDPDFKRQRLRVIEGGRF